ncbi:flagellar assembly peptidoglycan hydrolase FlgJ [Alteromonadaceae bacterium M269]|nr:flagellar assembly peptidoglycan hydrolase FlgJ [Alteromonadaceae bacterium M269]
MEASSLIQAQFEQARNVNDISSLDTLRQAAHKGDESALREAAQQFESIFIQMMLKSMRQAEDVFADEDSPFNSKQVKFYRDMHDQQLAVDLSSSGSIGLADIIVKQLSQNVEGFTPASTVRSDGNLSSINRARAANLENIQNNYAGAPGKKLPVFESPEEFVAALLPSAEKAAAEIGLDPLALVAQAAVETGWGKQLIHSGQGQNSHNLFGIKADSRWKGEKASVETLEFKQGVPHKEQAQFRAYPSFEQSMKDYVDFVKESPRYANAVEQAGDSKAYFEQLQQAGYATDPQYSNKVIDVLNSSTIKQFSPSPDGYKGE